jgi:hypothetical protein
MEQGAWEQVRLNLVPDAVLIPSPELEMRAGECIAEALSRLKSVGRSRPLAWRVGRSERTATSQTHPNQGRTTALAARFASRCLLRLYHRPASTVGSCLTCTPLPLPRSLQMIFNYTLALELSTQAGRVAPPESGAVGPSTLRIVALDPRVTGNVNADRCCRSVSSANVTRIALHMGYEHR